MMKPPLWSLINVSLGEPVATRSWTACSFWSGSGWVCASRVGTLNGSVAEGAGAAVEADAEARNAREMRDAIIVEKKSFMVK